MDTFVVNQQRQLFFLSDESSSDHIYMTCAVRVVRLRDHFMYTFNLDYKESLAIFSLHLIVIIYKNMRLHTRHTMALSCSSPERLAWRASRKAAAGCFLPPQLLPSNRSSSVSEHHLEAMPAPESWRAN